MNDLFEIGVFVIFFCAIYFLARWEDKKIRDKDKIEFKE